MARKDLLKADRSVLAYDFWDDSAVDLPDGELPQTTGASGERYHVALYVPAVYQPDKTSISGDEVFLVSQKKNVWVIPLTGCGSPMIRSVHFTRKDD